MLRQERVAKAVGQGRPTIAIGLQIKERIAPCPEEAVDAAVGVGMVVHGAVKVRFDDDAEHLRLQQLLGA